MNQSNLRICLRPLICAGLFTVIGTVGARDAFAQTENFPIEGSGGASVACLSAGAIQRTGKSFGSSPTTVIGCVLAGDAPYGLAALGVSVYCKGGSPIQFDPGAGKLQSCTLAYDSTLPINGTPMACKGGLGAQFSPDGRLLSCNLAPPAARGGGGGGGGTGGTGGGGGGNNNLPPSGGAHAAIVVPGESASISGGGQLSLIGASSNRPGSRAGYLYLGDGRASATYTAQAPAAGKYALWIRFDDDGKHAPGARGVEISVNGTVAIRWSNESRALQGWTNIPVGSVDLRAGANTIVFTKAATTSAAFVLDEFMLSDQPGYVPQ